MEINMDKHEETDLELLKAISYSSKSGRVDVAIDFSSQIHGFGGHKTREPSIYSCREYSIWSDLPSIATNVDRLHEKTDFYNAKHIFVSYDNYSTRLLLEDEALKWWMEPQRCISDFYSTDFLEQTFITHTIWRIQEHTTAFAPWKDLLIRYRKEDEMLLQRVLSILSPKTEEAAQKYFKQTAHIISYDDIYNRVYLLVSKMAFGEGRVFIESALKDEYERPAEKLKRKQEFRDFNLHPLRSHKIRNGHNINVESTKELIVNETAQYISQLSNHDSLHAAETAILMLQRDALSMGIVGAMNRNSKRVYKPWFEANIIDYIFGRSLFWHLKDYFKTELKRARSKIEYNDEYFYGESIEVGNKQKSWKTYRDKKTIPENVFLQIQSVLGGRKRPWEAYQAFLNGTYNSADQNMRQNLRRAAAILRKSDLSLKDVPLPRSRR
jgi:hypothetical protein